MVSNHQARPNGGRLTGEFALPKRIPQDHRGCRTASHIVFQTEQASSGGRNAQRSKKFAADPKKRNTARFGSPAHAFGSVSTFPSTNPPKPPLGFLVPLV